LNLRRDVRFAKRIRGALASLRERHGEDATLLVVAHMPQRPLVMEALERLPEPEEISSTVTPSGKSEEE
jgi:broad specificity phosphatase PhoE